MHSVGGWLHAAKAGQRFLVGNNYRFIINGADGTVIREITKGGVRGMSFMIDGELYNAAAYTSLSFLIPKGEVLREFPPYAQPGGCGTHTLTPKYIFRGQMVHSLSNPEEAFASSGFRPHCEAPGWAMVRLFGSVWYLRLWLVCQRPI